MHEYRKLTNIALSYYRNTHMLILTKTDHLLQEPNQRCVKVQNFLLTAWHECTFHSSRA